MADQKIITWKAKVEFVGKVEDFVKLAEALSAAEARIEVGKVPRPEPLPGYIAPRFVDTTHIYKMLDEAKVQRIIGLINGGIRTPHFHIGKEIALVDREQFKAILGQVARDVFEHRALLNEDYMEVITPLVEMEG